MGQIKNIKLHIVTDIKKNIKMSAANVLQLFRSSSSRCLCLLPPRLIAVTPTQTPTPTTRLLSTQPQKRTPTSEKETPHQAGNSRQSWARQHETLGRQYRRESARLRWGIKTKSYHYGNKLLRTRFATRCRRRVSDCGRSSRRSVHVRRQ